MNARDPDGERDVFAGAALGNGTQTGGLTAEKTLDPMQAEGDSEGAAYLAELLDEYQRDGRWNPATRLGVGPIAYAHLVAAGIV